MSSTAQIVIPLLLLAFAYLTVGLGTVLACRRYGFSLRPAWMAESAADPDAWLKSITDRDSRA